MLKKKKKILISLTNFKALGINYRINSQTRSCPYLLPYNNTDIALFKKTKQRFQDYGHAIIHEFFAKNS